jgi:tetratricopeptide (TPR) repeat protein
MTQKYQGIPCQKLTDTLPKLMEWRNFQEAKSVCSELLRRNPSQPQIRLRLVNINMMLGHKEDALDDLNLVIQNNPGQPQLIIQKMNMLGRMGRFDEACEIASKIRAAGNDLPGLAIVEAEAAFQRGDYEKTVELTRSALTDVDQPDETRIRPLFLCGSAYDKMNEPDKAMEMLKAANRLNGIPFEKKRFTELIDRLIDRYSEENLATVPRSGQTSDRPAFLLTMARSGSSLLNQIIDSHPDAYGVGETGYFVHRRWAMVKEHGDGYPDNLFALTSKELDNYAQEYLDGAGRPNREGVVRTIDKSIDNFRDLGFIWQALPNARYIYLRRDPLDCCFSIYQHQFNSPNIQHYTSRLEEIGYVYMQQERLKEHWRKTLGIDILDVNYEDLTVDPEGEVRRILEFMGLPWDERCLKFYESKRGVNTMSLHQVNKPIYRDSVGKGAKYAKYMVGLKKVLGLDES